MRVATFDIDPELSRGLAESGVLDAVVCNAPAETPIGDALEASEAMLDAAAADRALIGGAGDWALGAALACSKAVVPYAYIADAGGSSGHYAGHLERLADRVVADVDDPATAIQDWLAEPGDR